MWWDDVSKQSMLITKQREKYTCTTQLSALKKHKKNLEEELRKWGTTLKKHNTSNVTTKVISTGKLEGNKAEKIKSAYHTKVYQMNVKYIPKIVMVCQNLDSQIANVENYIKELDTSITSLSNELNNKEK